MRSVSESTHFTPPQLMPPKIKTQSSGARWGGSASRRLSTISSPAIQEKGTASEGFSENGQIVPVGGGGDGGVTEAFVNHWRQIERLVGTATQSRLRGCLSTRWRRTWPRQRLMTTTTTDFSGVESAELPYVHAIYWPRRCSRVYKLVEDFGPVCVHNTSSRLGSDWISI